MNKKSIKAWEMFFDYLSRKYSLEYGGEWIDWYFPNDETENSFYNGWFKSHVGIRVN
jgi:hypothetical protein